MARKNDEVRNAYKLQGEGNVGAISFEGKSYFAKDGLFYLTSDEAAPFLSTEMLQPVIVAADQPAQAGLGLGE